VVVFVLEITRYSIKNPQLEPWVKFIWYLETKSEVSISHKLLPTDSIDIILNMSDRIEYQIGDNRLVASAFHFNGMRNKYGFIFQQGKLKVFGISFYPFGLYPFLHLPLHHYNNQIVDLQIASKSLSEKLESVLDSNFTISEMVCAIERVLSSTIMMNEQDIIILPILQNFYHNRQNTSINSFCIKNNLSSKTLERACLKYTGYTPKTLQRIDRFQNVSNRLIYSQQAEKLTELAYNNDYYDQAHFIKEFRCFSGASPSRFMKERITVKENTSYTFR